MADRTCPNCGATCASGSMTGVEYPYGDPHHYDGISEWVFPCCGARVGRWSGKVLAPGEPELRWGGN